MCSSRLQTRDMDGWKGPCLHLSSVDHKGQINNGMNKIVALESFSNLQKMLAYARVW